MMLAENIVHFGVAREADLALDDKAIDQLIAEGMAASLAANTHNTYKTGWQNWCHWASKRGLPVFPAGPGDLMRWLAALSAEGKKPTTLGPYLSAVAYLHRRSPGPNPAHCSKVRQLLAGLRRQAAADGFCPRQAAPLRQHHVEQIADAAHVPRRNQPGGREETRQQARKRADIDIAMICLAHGAQRPAMASNSVPSHPPRPSDPAGEYLRQER